ncbi:MAG: M15 family metallopeptidase [Proteobacteria bacterium]|nr:M15 family metallopeptidase [Pseudomonadota bacterium]
MRLSEKQRGFTLMVTELVLFSYARGLELTLGEAYRTKEQQELHIKSGLSRVKHSRHQDRLAIDMNLFVDGAYVRDKERYRVLGEKWEALGGRWGGRFGVAPEDFEMRVGWDAGHFEYGG